MQDFLPAFPHLGSWELRKKLSKHTNQVFLFIRLREDGHFRRADLIPSCLRSRKTAQRSSDYRSLEFSLLNFYKREIHPEFWELLQAACEGLIACLIFLFLRREFAKRGLDGRSPAGFLWQLLQWVSALRGLRPIRELLPGAFSQARVGEHAPLRPGRATGRRDVLAPWESVVAARHFELNRRRRLSVLSGKERGGSRRQHDLQSPPPCVCPQPQAHLLMCPGSAVQI